MNSFFFKSLQHLFVLLTIALTLPVPGVVRAQIQESPLDTQILPVGQMFSLIIKGDGESNPPARITAEGLPPESVFLRNLDGSRTFIWIPDESNQGTSSFLVTIADGNDASLAATYPINLEVVASVQQPEEEINLADNQAASTTAPAPPAEETTAADTTDTAADALEAAQLHTAEVVDINEAKADTDAAAEPAAASPTLDTDSTVVGTTSDASLEDDSSSEVTAAAPVVDSGNPTLLLPEGLTAVVNREISIPIRHSSSSGSPSQLRAMNLPQGAALSVAPDGHILTWTPGFGDTGTTAIILIASDEANPSLSTTRRLGIEVLAR